MPYAAIAPFTDLRNRNHRLTIAVLHGLQLVAVLSSQHLRPAGLAVRRSVSQLFKCGQEHHTTPSTSARCFKTPQPGVPAGDSRAETGSFVS